MTPIFFLYKNPFFTKKWVSPLSRNACEKYRSTHGFQKRYTKEIKFQELEIGNQKKKDCGLKNKNVKSSQKKKDCWLKKKKKKK